MRTLVYTDYAYRSIGGRIRSERAFSLFVAAVADQLDGEVVVLGRVRPESGDAHYELGSRTEFVSLPWYRSLVSPGAIPALLRSLAVGWREIGRVDRVWLLGPHPLILILALFALLRRRPLVLGVRQDFPAYVRSRHPGSRLLQGFALMLEGSFRALARSCPVVVVGPQLARNYSRSRALLEIPVSLVRAGQIVDRETALERDYSGTKTILSVGRLDTEKNPLLLAGVLDRLGADGGGSWRLEVCGEGPLQSALEGELERLGLADRAELAGYVPFDGGLVDRYRRAHVLLHCSWTEGLPQVLLEALAAGLPVVASDVGGIREALGDAVVLVAAGDERAAAAAAAEIAADRALRAGLIDRGLAYIREHTLEHESARVARFLERAGGSGNKSPARSTI